MATYNLRRFAHAEGLDYDQLVNVLMNPDTDTPKGLLDALYFTLRRYQTRI